MVVPKYDGQLSFSIINTEMTVKAMRDSGYKSTTHALAELVDNAIEADATAIELFGIGKHNEETNRITLEELAVLDNGRGMDAATLRGSLRYGFGYSDSSSRNWAFWSRTSEFINVTGETG